MAVTALVPLKALTHAKGRLAPALDAAERREFVAWMARRVIAACLACPTIDDVLVIAGDAAAAEVAARAGARPLLVTEPGLDVALAAGDKETRARAATLVVAADLPAATPEDLSAVIGAAGTVTGPVVVVAPTRDGGTGALLRRPPGVIPTAYGPASAAAHLRLAAAAGVMTLVVQRPGLAEDVDTPEHLPDALAWTAAQAVPSARSHPPTEESACRKAP